MADKRAELGAGTGVRMFSLKKWNAVAMWSWDVECDTCAICRVQVMDACLRCQAENKQEDCVGLQGTIIRGSPSACRIFFHYRGFCRRNGNTQTWRAHHCGPQRKYEAMVWGECNHSFHNCCMSLWVKQNNRCPLCQQDWVVQRIGK